MAEKQVRFSIEIPESVVAVLEEIAVREDRDRKKQAEFFVKQAVKKDALWGKKISNKENG